MSKYLILSCNTGEGHNSAAASIKEYFEQKGLFCEIKDALSFWSPEKSKIISKGHVFIYRKLPTLFGMGYRLLEGKKPPKEGSDSIMYDLVTHGCEELLSFLRCNDFEAVICTHLFSAFMMTELKKSRLCSLPFYFVLTDYTCYPGIKEADCDAMFIPHPALKDDFMAIGIPESTIVPTGIPIRPSFYDKQSKAKAKTALKLNPDKRIVLLTSGSMGCGPIKSLADMLCERMPSDVQLVTICGSNKRLYNSLSKDTPENLTVVGYTTEMSLYMDAADLILTKAGGLSSTEAAIKSLPLVFINAVPGCETRNRDFFVSRGLAETADKEKELVDIVCACLSDPERLNRVRERLKSDFDFCAVEEIYKYLSKEKIYETV